MSNHPEDYDQYIASKEWKSFRDSILAERKECKSCGSSQKLHLHHKHYRNFKQETPDDVEVLCFDCHNKFHAFAITNQLTIAKASRFYDYEAGAPVPSFVPGGKYRHPNPKAQAQKEMGLWRKEQYLSGNWKMKNRRK